jgi:hypothetical protein
MTAFETAESLARELPFPQGPFSLSYNRWYSSLVQLELGLLDAAEATVDASLELAARHGQDFWTMAATLRDVQLGALRRRATPSVHRVALIESAATMAGLVMNWELLGVRIFLPPLLTMVGQVLGWTGDVDGAVERFDQSLALAEETGVRFYDAETARLRAMTLDEPATVVRELRVALDLARSQGALPFQLRIARELFEREGDRARPLLVETLGEFAAGASYPELDDARRALSA